MKHRSAAAWLALALAATTASVAEATDYRLPPDADASNERGVELAKDVRLTPFVRVGALYTNNVYSEDRQLMDWVFSLTGGGDVRVGSEGTWASVGYAPTFLGHARRSRLNRVEHRLRYAAQAKVAKFVLSSQGNAAWAHTTNSDPQYPIQVRVFRGSTSATVLWQPTEVWGGELSGGVNALQFARRVFQDGDTVVPNASGYLLVTPNTDVPVKLEIGSAYRHVLYTHDRIATSPDLGLVDATIGARAMGDWYRVTARVGYGWSWIDKRRTFPDGRPGVDRAIGLLSASVNPIRTLTIGVNAQRSLQHSPAYGYFVQSMVGAEVSQQFPLGITASASASYDVQEPRRGPIRRTQHYLLSVGWVPRELDFLEISLQSGYDYSRTRASHFEVFHAAAVVTLRL